MKASALAVAIALSLHSGPAGAQTAGTPAPEFAWAGDAEGGAPFVEADPSRPDEVVGFDVDIASLIARGLGRVPRFVMISFASIDQSITRGDADIGLSGIEDTAARRAALSVTLPYYEFREVLAVRNEDAGRLRTLSDLRGRNVGTLAGTIAYDILLEAEREHGLHTVSYEDDVHPYSDLLLGRVDAVLLDHVLAERRQRAMPGITIQPSTVAIGHYIGVLAAANAPLRNAVNDVLLTAMKDGTLERIFRKWNVWNEDQPKLYAKLLAGETVPPVLDDRGRDASAGASVATLSKWDAARRWHWRSSWAWRLRPVVSTVRVRCSSSSSATSS
jgi:ABC-type amino acid transport substrate-binding protein